MRAAVIDIQGQKLDYYIRESSRARRTRIAVDAGGNVVVTKPQQLGAEAIEGFIRQKYQWIQDKKEVFSRSAEQKPDLARTDKLHFHLHRADCLELVRSKVAKWNKTLNYPVSSIRIKQMTSRWGSCTASNALSFNYKLLFLPDEIQDYVVVHELCHIQEKNHSSNFWCLVDAVTPNRPELVSKLRDF